MNIVDKIFIAIALVALWRGYMNGVIVEVSGIIGLIVGAYGAYYFCDDLAPYLKLSESIGLFVAGAIIFVVSLVAVHLLAKLVSFLLKLSGVGIVDGLLGSVASLLKVALFIALIYTPVTSYITKHKWVNKSYFKEAKSTPIIKEFSNVVLPQFDFLVEEFEAQKDALDL